MMAIPVIAGIPWLAGLLGGLFTALLGYFGKFLTKKFAVVAALIALIVSATTAFIALITGLMASISAASPDFIGLAIQMVVPENAYACVSVMATARLARWAYEWNVKIIQYKLL